MKSTFLLVATTLLVACAGQDEKEQSTQDAVQAMRDFIAVRNLEELDKMPMSSSDSWHSIEDRFLIYKGRRSAYLVEFSRRCDELQDNTRIVADVRYDSRHIHSRFDTIRGCRIRKIYALDEAAAAEAENLGEAPGSRN
jgi:hypothetical protein